MPLPDWRWISIPTFFHSQIVDPSTRLPHWQACDCSFGTACRPACPFSDWIIETILEAAAPYRAGLVWLPANRYPTASVFEIAVGQLGGVAWPLGRLPAGLQIGQTLVVVAHRVVIARADQTMGAAMVFAFKPTDVVYYPAANEPQENLRRAEAQGVRVLPAEDPPSGAF